MTFSVDLIAPAVARYRRERDRYVKLADRVTTICREDICEQNAIRAQVTFRVKTEKSFERKLRRFSVQEHRNFSSVDEIFFAVGDLAGVRISAYQEQDCEIIVEKLRDIFGKTNGATDIKIDRKDKKAPDNENYYRAIHAQISLPDDQLIGIYDNVGDISCEIQVCTMIAHVWNEIEHDIGYKPDLGEPSDDEKYHLNQLGLLVRQGDSCITALMSAYDRRVMGQTKEATQKNPSRIFVDVHDFVSWMRDFLGNSVANFAENSGQLFDLLVDLGAKSAQEIQMMLENLDIQEEARRISQLNVMLSNAGIDGLILDPATSDIILMSILHRQPDKIRAALKGRAGRGKGRPSRLHRIAIRYLDSFEK